MSEIELILTKLKIVSEAKEQGVYVCDKEHSKILLDYMQRQKNIIKEVREYIKENNYHCKNQVEQEQYDKELLEILDKENKWITR